MSHVLIYKTDYGHLLQVLVEEHNELTGVDSVADLDPYSSKTIIMKKPDGSVLYLTATASGLGYVNALIPSGAFSMTGYYNFEVLLQNALQQFHSTEFGFNVTIPIDQ